LFEHRAEGLVNCLGCDFAWFVTGKGMVIAVFDPVV
jgi:hypothetical protein